MMDGANRIDVVAANFPRACPVWVTVYSRGRGITPDTPPWRERRRQAEEAVRAALTAIAAPF